MSASAARRSRLNLLRGLGVSAAAWAVLALLYLLGLFEPLDLKFSDLRFKLRGQQTASSEIALVELDDATIDAYGRWPLPRDVYALLATALTEAGARVVGMDLLFLGSDGYDPRNDLLLATLSEQSPMLVHAMAFQSRDQAEAGAASRPGTGTRLARHSIGSNDGIAGPAAAVMLPFEGLLEATPHLGHVSVSVDPDGVVRRVPMIVGYADMLFPSLSLQMLSVAEGKRIRNVERADGHLVIRWDHGASLRIPVDGEGSTPIDFRGGRSVFENRYPMLDVLQWYRDGDSERLAAAFRNRIVLVGNTAVGKAATDVGATPFSNAEPLVYVHANAVDSMLRDAFIRRPPDWMYLGILALAALGLGVLFVHLPLPRAAIVAGGAFILAGVVEVLVFILARVDIAAIATLALPVFSYAGVATYRFIFLERTEREREKELDLARDIQRRLLPSAPPDVTGLDVFGYNLPAFEVGGDYYDWVVLPDRSLIVVLGDVCGKGVGASLLMSHLRASFQAEAKPGRSASEIVQAVHESLYRATEDGHFATFFLALFHPDGSRFQWANAGHNPSILSRTGDQELLVATGPPLACLPGITFRENECEFGAGDVLVLYSDGITECPGTDPMYEEERLETLVKSLAGSNRTATEIGEAVLEDVRGFAGKAIGWDDVTIVVVRRGEEL